MLFEVANGSNTIPMESKVSIISLYTIFFCSIIAVPINVVRDWNSKSIFMALVEAVFLILVCAAVISFWKIRNLRMTKNIISIAVALLSFSLIMASGGVRGLGYLYFLAGYSILFHVMGVRGGVILPIFLFSGALIRILLGAYGPESIFNDPGLTVSFMVPFFVATVLGVISVIYQHQLIKHLSRAAYLDPITGIANRTKIEEYLGNFLTVAELKNLEVSIIALKVLEFTRANANLGGTEADKVLLELSRRFSVVSPPRSLVGRYSGTLFLMISPLSSIPAITEFVTALETSLFPSVFSRRPRHYPSDTACGDQVPAGRTEPGKIARKHSNHPDSDEFHNGTYPVL